MLIAIDGLAASGKGTLGRRLAEHFGLVYLDTGKLYRAVGAALLQQGWTAKQIQEASKPVQASAVAVAEGLTLAHLAQYDLRTEEVGHAASVVAAMPEVRDALLAFQRHVASSSQGALLDGRDIGTVVCPEADFKFFVVADTHTRAERRYKELQSTQKSVTKNAILRDLEARDARDKAREVAPLVCADDAIKIDSTQMDAQAVFEHVLNIMKTPAS